MWSCLPCQVSTTTRASWRFVLCLLNDAHDGTSGSSRSDLCVPHVFRVIALGCVQAPPHPSATWVNPYNCTTHSVDLEQNEKPVVCQQHTCVDHTNSDNCTAMSTTCRLLAQGCKHRLGHTSRAPRVLPSHHIAVGHHVFTPIWTTLKQSTKLLETILQQPWNH